MRQITSKLAKYLAVALLLPAIPASASDVTLHAPAPVWQLSIRTDAPLVLRTMDDNRWTPSATSPSNAGMSRAVDRLINPPEQVDVFATQTGDAVHGRFQGTDRPNETIAAFRFVIH